MPFRYLEPFTVCCLVTLIPTKLMLLSTLSVRTTIIAISAREEINDIQNDYIYTVRSAM